MYWLCSFPLGDEAPERVWARLQELTAHKHDYSTNFKFRLPDNLKVGTLDSLMALSDDLIKVNSAVEGTVNKIRRQLYELQSGLTEEERSEVWVEGMTPEGYLQRFTWNEAKYPSRRPPKDTVQAIMETIQKLDEDLKAKSVEYMQARTALQALLRRSSGSLAVRDLSSAIPPAALVSTDNLTTVVAVVGKSALPEWHACYENLTEYVVPRSTVKVAEDGDFVALTAVMFRRVVDDFKAAGRARGFQVRELAAAAAPLPVADAASADVGGGGGGAEQPAASAAGADDGVDRRRGEVEAKRSALIQWCVSSYGEAFSSWIHVTSVRLWVESILRYGVPPRFLAVLMRPNPRYTAQLRKVLAASCGAVGGQHFTSEGAGDDLFPYVSFTLNIEEQ